MRKKLLSVALALSMLCPVVPVQASSNETDMKIEIKASVIDVNMPTELPVVFESDGSNTIPDFVIQNNSTVDLNLHRVTFSEIKAVAGDQWSLTAEPDDFLEMENNVKTILVKTGAIGQEKGLILQENPQQTALKDGIASFESGELKVPKNQSRSLGIKIKRGVFTKEASATDAFKIKVDFNFSAD